MNKLYYVLANARSCASLTPSLRFIMAEPRFAEFQWNSFCSNVLADWAGAWTFWDPHTGSITRSFNGVRSFKALNEEKSIIIHDNIGHNKGAKGPWKIRKEDTDEKGIVHPVSPRARSVLLANGGGVWAPVKTADFDALAFEIFLCQGKHRCSIIPVYDKSNHLSSVGVIRETQADSHTHIWTPSKELLESFPLSWYNKDFFGVENTFDSNYRLSSICDCKWDKNHWLRSQESSEKILFKFFPDSICLSCPSQMSPNSAFSLCACALFPNGDDKELQELTLSYADGQLHSVKQGLYR